MLYTDHKPLIFALSSTTERSLRQTRHLSFIAEFTPDIHYTKGKHIVVADTLSRINATLLPDLDFTALAADQATSVEIKAYRTAVSNLFLQDITFENFTLLCDVFQGHPRPILSREWTYRAFQLIHSLARTRPRRTQRVIAKRFVWHGMKKDVRKWCKKCYQCQASKIHRHVRAPLVTRTPPSGRFRSLHLDLVGPLPTSECMTYLLTIIDRYTRWPEAVPLPDAKTSTCVKALIRLWIARFGVPDDITSDRGPQFTSVLWTELGKTLGIHLRNTTAYHPQANGMIERLHRQLKAALKARTADAHWMDHLSIVLLGLRVAWREDPDCSPAELVYGSSLRLPGEFVDPTSGRTAQPTSAFLRDLQQTMQTVLPPPPVYHNNCQHYVPDNLAQTGYVYVRVDNHRSPLQRPYEGPFRIVSIDDKYFTLDLNGRFDKISVDRLKPACISTQPDSRENPNRTFQHNHDSATTRSGRTIRRPSF